MTCVDAERDTGARHYRRQTIQRLGPVPDGAEPSPPSSVRPGQHPLRSRSPSTAYSTPPRRRTAMSCCGDAGGLQRRHDRRVQSEKRRRSIGFFIQEVSGSGNAFAWLTGSHPSGSEAVRFFPDRAIQRKERASAHFVAISSVVRTSCATYDRTGSCSPRSHMPGTSRPSTPSGFPGSRQACAAGWRPTGWPSMQTT